MGKTLLIILFILIVGIGAYFLGINKKSERVEIPTDTGDSQPVLTPEDLGNSQEKEDLIFLTNLKPNQVITSPLEIEGKARGNWYFEAQFPVFLYDSDGKVLANGIAKAQGDWMTSNFVLFSASLVFSKPVTETGNLVLKKDNPSGLPENDDQLSIPVKFQ